MADGLKVPRSFRQCKHCTAVGPPCDTCHGSGNASAAANPPECPACKGTGLEAHTVIIASCKG